MLNRLIDNQLEQIASLKDENTALKESASTKKALFDSPIENVFTCDVKLKITSKGLMRSVTRLDNLDIQSKTLGYSKKELLELWSLDQWYPVLARQHEIEHPMEVIVAKPTKEKLLSLSEELPSLLRTLKQGFSFDGFTIAFEINYIAKDGSIIAAYTENKLHPFNLLVTSRTVFKEGKGD